MPSPSEIDRNPRTRSTKKPAKREAVPTWGFALVVVRLGHRFLVVHERKHGQLWYLPAGRVEPGESFEEAARREALEESGIPVVLEGVLRVEHTPQPTGSARLRIVFLARPEGDTGLKSEPDEHTLEARWVSLPELAGLPQRGPGMAQLFREVLDGAPVYPLSLLGPELA